MGQLGVAAVGPILGGGGRLRDSKPDQAHWAPLSSVPHSSRQAINYGLVRGEKTRLLSSHQLAACVVAAMSRGWVPSDHPTAGSGGKGPRAPNPQFMLAGCLIVRQHQQLQ